MMPAKGNAIGRKAVGMDLPGRRPRQQSSKKAAALQRRRRALDLKAAGASYAQIGAQLGVSGKTAFYDVQMAAGEYTEETMRLAARYKEIELHTLDMTQRHLVPILQGTTKVRPAEQASAANAIVRVSERRSKLLGLDAPTQNEFGGIGGGPIRHEVEAMSDEEILRRVDLVRGALTSPQPALPDIETSAVAETPESRYEAELSRRHGRNGNGNQ